MRTVTKYVRVGGNQPSNFNVVKVEIEYPETIKECTEMLGIGGVISACQEYLRIRRYAKARKEYQEEQKAPWPPE